MAQNTVFSTHDHTLSIVPPVGELPFRETWADVRMPGGWPDTAVGFLYPPGFPPTTDRRTTYVVGTIEVNRTTPGSLFSGASASMGTLALSPFTFLGTGPSDKRQVVMTQWNAAAPTAANAIVRQRYFFGLTGGSGPVGEDFTRATNARAISVWETSDPSSTRVAICGETYDERLPLVQAAAATGWASASAAHPSGFIAVYDGTGALRWTHHFFDPAAPSERDCAITDVSIRVDGAGDDVVTYCGISTHGSPAGGELAPRSEFLPASTCSGGSPAVPAGQWDAFVGRVTSSGAGTSARVFHSVVSGGGGQDLLMGIVEIDEDRFAVAGSTEAGAGASTFPFTTQCGLAGPHVLGTVMVFDASGVGPGGTGNLVLERSEPLGTPGTGRRTVARDICVGRAAFGGFTAGDDLLYVVGSTDDGAFQSGAALFAVSPPPGQGTLLGATDGFLAAMWVDSASSLLQPWTFSYHGGPGADGLTGIDGWGEFSEHRTVTGFTDDGAGAIDIDVGTYFFNNAVGPVPPTFTGPPNTSGQLLRVRRYAIGGTTEDRPAVMGPTSVSTAGTTILEFGLGQESGGGVAVGNDGRANVVGRTTTGGGYPLVGATARSPDLLTDAVRTELDVVERAVGVGGGIGTGRTDGTGFQGGVTGFFPPATASGLTGGTTPFCALSEFGWRNGVPPGPGGSWLPRMLIDVEGSLTASSTDAAILVSRPTFQTGSVAVGALQFGFPPTTPSAVVTGAEFWLGSAPPVTTFTVFPNNQAFRLPLPILPAGGGPVSAQLVCLLVTPVTGPGGCSSIWTASPSLWFTW